MYDIEYARQVLYAGAGAVAWLTWDLIVHFDIEVECIWRLRRSWAKWAYFFVRYVPILHSGAVLTLGTGAHFSTAGCRGWLYHQILFMEILTLVVEVILVMRLYILFSQNRIVLWIMVLAFITEITLMVVTLGLVLPKMTFTPDCLVASSPNLFMSYWLSPLVFETFLFVLILVKFIQSVSRTLGRQSILFVFMRDGTWAFAMIFVAMLLNTLLYKLNTTPLVGMGYLWALATMSFAGSHVLLNLRRLGVPQEESILETTTQSVFADFHDLGFTDRTRYGTMDTTTVGDGHAMTVLRRDIV